MYLKAFAKLKLKQYERAISICNKFIYGQAKHFNHFWEPTEVVNLIPRNLYIQVLKIQSSACSLLYKQNMDRLKERNIGAEPSSNNQLTFGKVDAKKGSSLPQLILNEESIKKVKETIKEVDLRPKIQLSFENGIDKKEL